MLLVDLEVINKYAARMFAARMFVARMFRSEKVRSENVRSENVRSDFFAAINLDRRKVRSHFNQLIRLRSHYRLS